MITMYDTIAPSEIPASPQAVAGYVSGSWPDFNRIVAMFPHAQHLSIAPTADHDADCLDVERGDATPGQAPAWVVRQHSRGVHRPCIYADRSTMPAVEQALSAIPRGSYRLWVADWTYSPHLPAGFDACQWTDRALGRNLDQSVCADSFFSVPQPAPDAKGVANAAVHFDLGSGQWQVEPTPGKVTFGPDDKWASAEVQINVKTGEWRVKPLPWNAPPLG